MKSNKKLFAALMALALIANFSVVASIPASAHELVLNVDYDACEIDENNSDGIDERWYVLNDRLSVSYHFPHNIDTITYKFQGDSEDWSPDGISAALGEETKAILSNSIEKWNNVYFYFHNADGTITKKKIINVTETTGGDANINIYPTNSNSIEIEGAQTRPEGIEGLSHEHVTSWNMLIDVELFHENTVKVNALHLTIADITVIREYTGAHELGHVLGLFDLDNFLCGSNISDQHHHETLMGYGTPVYERSGDITYKDIAGVAITRGFHTDDDHKWLKKEQSDGTYKYVCSICNGIPKDSNFTPSSYDIYGSCGEVHTLSGGNMMAVASYGNQDYYKCKYCRYVAPFSEIVVQNYSKICCSADYHKCVNIVDGLEYTFYEPHTLVDGICTECTSHEYGIGMFQNKFSHKRLCACGKIEVENHYISGTHVGEDWVPCAGCGYLLDMRNDIHEGIMSITQVSINGSYIRSDGIVVLVDEDIEAYLAGTLQFYHPANLPVTQ